MHGRDCVRACMHASSIIHLPFIPNAHMSERCFARQGEALSRLCRQHVYFPHTRTHAHAHTHTRMHACIPCTHTCTAAHATQAMAALQVAFERSQQQQWRLGWQQPRRGAAAQRLQAGGSALGCRDRGDRAARESTRARLLSAPPSVPPSTSHPPTTTPLLTLTPLPNADAGHPRGRPSCWAS